jgi:1,4-alpha-glucan branching enzyme
VTGPVPLSEKRPYEPERALERARAHAEHFVSGIEERAPRLRALIGERPVICAMYDAELFGHWWFEGVDFLGFVFRRIAERGIVAPAAPSEVLGREGGFREVLPARSSWGADGHSQIWLNPETDWMYPPLHLAEDRMAELARLFPRAEGRTRRLLDQAARELMLAQSSDWAFLITTASHREYAERRARGHLERFERLRGAVLAGKVDEAGLRELEDLEERDAIFPEMDYRVYAPA